MPLTKEGWRPWQPGDPVRVLPYGKSKIGKTFGAGTFPRPCFMDFDRGIGTLFSPDFLRQHGYREVLHRAFYERSFKGPIVSAHNAYDDACKFFDEMMAASKRDTFDTWVIDSGTTLGEDAQNKAVILLGTKDYGEMSHTHEQALKHQLLVPKIQDYGAERSLVEQFADMILSTDKHVVFICHEKEQRNKVGDLIGIAPLLTGKSDEAIPLRFDEVYNIQAQKEGASYDKEAGTITSKWVRYCITQPDGTLKVGSRNGVPDKTPWNYESILAAMTKNYEEREKFKREANQAAQAVAEKSGHQPAA